MAAGGPGATLGTELVEDALGVDGLPGDDRVDDDREAERLLALLLGGALPDVAFVGEEDRSSEGVELLSFVELPPDTAAQFPRNGVGITRRAGAR